jgi:hypothetical protein
MYNAVNKWTESYSTYNEIVKRIVEMEAELSEQDCFLLIINDPSGTQVQSVSK